MGTGESRTLGFVFAPWLASLVSSSAPIPHLWDGRTVPEEGKLMRLRHVGRAAVSLGQRHREKLRIQVALEMGTGIRLRDQGADQPVSEVGVSCCSGPASADIGGGQVPSSFALRLLHLSSPWKPSHPMSSSSEGLGCRPYPMQ